MMTSTPGRSYCLVMTLRKCSEKSAALTSRSFLWFKELSSVPPNPTSRHRSWSWNVETASRSDSWMWLQARLLMSHQYAWEEFGIKRNALQTLSLQCLTVRLWTFKTWRSKKPLKKYPVAKLPEPTIWSLIDTMCPNVSLVIESELQESWSLENQRVKPSQKEAFMWLGLRNWGKELLSNTQPTRRKHSRKWPKIQDSMKRSRNRSLLVFMVTNKSRRQSLACSLEVQESFYLTKLY